METAIVVKVSILTVVVVFVILAGCAFVMTQPVVNDSPLLSTYSAQASPEKLRAHVDAIVSNFGPRDCDHPQNLNRVADYIAGQFEAGGLPTERQRFVVSGTEYQNVIARVGKASERLLVIGAHYDSAGPLPAADDNASGVAGLLEVARLLSGSGLETEVVLVAYSLEEPPYFATEHMGSAVHARSLKEKGVQLVAMISLEMIGFFTDAPGSQEYPMPGLSLLYPDTGNFIGVVGLVPQTQLVRRVKTAMLSATPLPVHSINAPGILEGVVLSDHLSYLNAGYPGIMITDTAMYRNKAYHTAEDTPDRLDYSRMAMVVDGVVSAAHILCKREE